MPFGFGECPPGYNPKSPWTLRSICLLWPKGNSTWTSKAWSIARMDFEPQQEPHWGRCVARGWLRWRFNYLTPKYASLAGPLQFIAATCVFFYAINYDKTYSKHRQRKYQW